MNGNDKDPMLSNIPDEQKNYRNGIMDMIRNTVEEDRRNRRERLRTETPAALIGGTGLSSGLTQSL